MVWHTSTGDRVLNKIEAEFYLTVLQDSLSSHFFHYQTGDYEIEELELWASTGDGFFDRASFKHQIVLINFCLKALLKPDIPMPELDHILEAAAFYPFAYLQEMVESEIQNQSYAEKDNTSFEEDEYTYFYRKITWDAFEKMILPDLMKDAEDYGEEPDTVSLFYEQKYKSKDVQEWEFAIDCLADIIFWDRDWFLVSIQPQLLDGMEKVQAEFLGITDNYFSNRLSNITDEDAVEALKEIMKWEL